MSISLRAAALRENVVRPVTKAPARRREEITRKPDGGRRNVIIDVLRGYCIVMMITSHTGTDSYLNGGVHLLRFVSGAEGFVFLAGLVLGMVYRRKLDAAPASDSYRAIWRRAGLLWAVHCVLVLAALFANRLWFQYPDLPDPTVIGLPTLLWLTATLQLQPGHGLNILPLYVFLLTGAPVAFELLRRGKSLVLLALSSGLFVWTQYDPALGSWAHPLSGGDAFPVPAWQALFVGGLAVGYHQAVIRSTVLARSRIWLRWGLGLALAAVAFGVVIQSPWFQFYDHSRWDALLWERHPLRLGRVLYFLLSVSACYLLAQAWLSRKWLPHFPLHALATLGRNSLYAFLVHLVIAFVMAQYEIPYEQWLLIEAVPLATLGLIYVMARHQIARRWIPN